MIYTQYHKWLNHIYLVKGFIKKKKTRLSGHTPYLIEIHL